MRLHWYGINYGDRYTSFEEAKQDYDRRRQREQELSEEVRRVLAGMSRDEREHLLEVGNE